MLIDATQGVPFVDVSSFIGRVDYLVCAAYKHLLCPRGVAFLYVREDHWDELSPHNANWRAADSPFGRYFGGPLTLASDAARFDVSRGWMAWVGAIESLRLLLEWRKQGAFDEVRALARALADGLGVEPPQASLVCVPIDDAERVRAGAGRRGREGVRSRHWDPFRPARLQHPGGRRRGHPDGRAVRAAARRAGVTTVAGSGPPQAGATVRFGIAGSGFMAHTYAQCLARHTRGTRLVAIGGGSRAPSLAAEYGVAAEPDVEALVSRPDVDAVIIATPHSLHLPHVLAAAAAGKHVYLEKPMARDIEDCDRMIAACRAAGVLLTVNKVTRFRESPRAAKRLLDDGAIGTLRMVRVTSTVIAYLPDEKGWVHDPAEGGAWLDMGAHLCDALRWFSGAEATTVFGRIHDFEAPPDLARSVMVQVEMANGVLAQIWMSFEVPSPGLGSQSQWLLVGSDGMIDLDAYGKVRLGRGTGWELVHEMPAFDLNADVYSPIRLAAFAEQVQDLADAIRDHRSPAVSGAEARAAIELVQAARVSDRTGAAVTLPLGTPAGSSA